MAEELNREDDIPGTEDVDDRGWTELGDDIDPDADVLIEGVNDDLINAQKVEQRDTTNLPLDSLSKEELIKKFAQLDESNRALRQQQDTDALLNNRFAELANVLKSNTPPPQPAPPLHPTETEEQFQERMRELSHDDPVKAHDEMLKRQIAPLLTSLAGNNVKTARSLIALDPVDGEIFRRFQGDVDALVAKRSDWEKLQDPDIYRKALNEVKAQKFSVLVEEEAKRRAEEILKKEGKDTTLLSKGTTPPTPAAPAGVRNYSETNYNPRAPQNPKKIIGVLTQSEKRKADVLGISYKEMYMSLKRRGLK